MIPVQVQYQGAGHPLFVVGERAYFTRYDP